MRIGQTAKLQSNEIYLGNLFSNRNLMKFIKFYREYTFSACIQTSHPWALFRNFNWNSLNNTINNEQIVRGNHLRDIRSHDLPDKCHKKL